MTAEEDDSERQQVEWVFGLTGGELDDKPWNGFAYNFDGVPEWASTNFIDRFDRQYHTVIGYFLFSEPPAAIVDDEGIWRLQAEFASSGETRCPIADDDGQDEDHIYVRREQGSGSPSIERCYLCDEQRGDEHGYIYLGDGWGEAVYRLSDADDEGEDGS